MVEVAVGAVVTIVGPGVAAAVVVVGSLQPNHPGVLQVEVEVEVLFLQVKPEELVAERVGEM